MTDENSWRTPAFRQSVVAKIDEAIRQSGMSPSRNSLEMENHVFQKAKNREEYLGFVARLILHVREINKKYSKDITIEEILVEVFKKKAPKLVKVISRLDLEKMKQLQQNNNYNIHQYLIDSMID